MDLDRHPILTSDELETITNSDWYEQETLDQHDIAYEYSTSGSTGDPKRIPYTEQDWATIIDNGADLLRTVGLDEDDVLFSLNPGPERQHMASWLAMETMEQVGGSTANDGIRDWETALEPGTRETVTAVMSSPAILTDIGNRIDAEYGDPADVFPDMETVISLGDTLTDRTRHDLIEQWDADQVRNMYAMTEAGYLAAEAADGNGMVPCDQKTTFEICKNDDPGNLAFTDVEEDDIYRLDDLEEPVEGRLLLSQPEREALPLIRYNTGDMFEAYPTDDGPRLYFLNREDHIISLGGAQLYEEQIDAALTDTYGDDLTDWKVHVTKDDEEKTALDVYVITDAEDRQSTFHDALFDRSSPVREAYEDIGIIDRIDTYTVSSKDDIAAATGTEITDTAKIQRILFDDSYFQ